MSAHAIAPQFLEFFQRHQCKVCHSWVNYSEATGKWEHTNETFADRMAQRSRDAIDDYWRAKQ